MKPISVFLDLTKFVDSRRKNADVTTFQRMSRNRIFLNLL